MLATIARGGTLGTDASGNAYIANVSGTTLTIEKLSPSLVSQWQATDHVLDGTQLANIGVDASGAVMVGWSVGQYDYVGESRFSSSGTFLSQAVASGESIAVDGANYIYTWNTNGTLWVTKRDFNSTIVWQRSFSGSANISQIAPAPDGGAVFGGSLQTAMDFGGGTLKTEQTENGSMNGFIVRLGSGGQHVFSKNTWYNYVRSLGTNGKHVVASGYQIGGAGYYWKLDILDMTGAFATDAPRWQSGFGDGGFGQQVWLGPDDHIYWNLEAIFGCCSSSAYLLAI